MNPLHMFSIVLLVFDAFICNTIEKLTIKYEYKRSTRLSNVIHDWLKLNKQSETEIYLNNNIIYKTEIY